jgi:transcription antitermination protein NusB
MKTPKDPRHQARRAAVSKIYSLLLSESAELTKTDSEEIIIESLDIKNYDKKMLNDIVNGVCDSQNELNQIIKNNSKDWDISKLYLTDLAILLVSVWEINNSDTPQKVIIDEAIELAKEFGETDSSKFINGVLSGVVNSNNSD